MVDTGMKGNLQQNSKMLELKVGGRKRGRSGQRGFQGIQQRMRCPDWEGQFETAALFYNKVSG